MMLEGGAPQVLLFDVLEPPVEVPLFPELVELP
jgi:hypothetical protein